MNRTDAAYLTRGATAPHRLAVGAVLALLGVTWPLLMGYAVAVVRATFRGDPAPPDVEEWEPIVRDGAIGTAIVVAFALPSVLLALLFGWRPGGTLSAGGGVIVAVLALASAYALPGALLRFAHRETLVAGLDAWTVLDVVLMPAYARTWFGVAVAVAVPAGVAWIIPSMVAWPALDVLVWIVTTLLGYVVVVLGARSLGHTYARIMRLESDASGVARRSSTNSASPR
jgi:hypothetical protein